MSDAITEKHFETSERSRSLRLQERRYPDSACCYVILEERREDGWERVGSVELGYGLTDVRGRFDQEIIAEWHHTRFHAASDCVRLSRRLRRQFDHLMLEIVLEEKREEVLGFDCRNEHGWQRQDDWQFEGPGGEQL